MTTDGSKEDRTVCGGRPVKNDALNGVCPSCKGAWLRDGHCWSCAARKRRLRR